MKRTLVCKNRGDETTCYYKTRGSGAASLAAKAVGGSIKLVRGIAKTAKYTPLVAKYALKAAGKKTAAKKTILNMTNRTKRIAKKIASAPKKAVKKIKKSGMLSKTRKAASRIIQNPRKATKRAGKKLRSAFR